MEAAAADAPPAAFVQPKPWIRWAAVALAIAGWYVSFYSFRLSWRHDVNDPLMRAVCGGAPGEQDGCKAVLTSDEAYFSLSSKPGAARIPLAVFGMVYFAGVGIWYLFIGPPAYAGRGWHLLIAVAVLAGAGYSAHCTYVMGSVLQRWCGSCLVAHTVNGGLVLLTLLAWPWARPAKTTRPHPTARLALATVLLGLLAFVSHFALVYMFMAGSVLQKLSEQYKQIVDDPAYIRWDFDRQPVVTIPLLDDEVFAGSPTADNTVIVFSDFQCSQCRRAHAAIDELLTRYPGGLRVAYRFFPQDPECNPHPNFQAGGHASACRAARAAHAARLVGGPQAYLRLQGKLFAEQSLLPTKPYARQNEQQREILLRWAAELGLDPAAFAEAMESPAVKARIAADIETANQLGIAAMPVVYLNGKLLRNWWTPDIWDALLGEQPAATRPSAAAPGP